MANPSDRSLRYADVGRAPTPSAQSVDTVKLANACDAGVSRVVHSYFERAKGRKKEAVSSGDKTGALTHRGDVVGVLTSGRCLGTTSGSS